MSSEKLVSNTLETSDLYYEVFGTGDPILFLHGFGANIASWSYIVSLLSKQYKLILVDLRGFGASPKPIDNKYSIKDHAFSIYEFVQKHDLKNLTIAGHSLGGGVALITALRLINDGQNRLSSLILIDSVGYRQILPAFLNFLGCQLSETSEYIYCRVNSRSNQS
jgi:pimeloyl-ACP methyl ester carboxylesterase